MSAAPQDFWSRRKAAARAEAEAEQQAIEAETADVERARLEARDDAEILADLDLPDPDTLAPGDSIQGFMSHAVPDRLRRRALRQLWKLNPALANLDGLVDYGEDFTDAATVIENMQTTYQVGKGMLAHIQEMARQAEEAAKAAEEGPEDAPEPEAAPEDPLPEPEPPAPYVFADADSDPDPAPTPRRMRFEFQG